MESDRGSTGRRVLTPDWRDRLAEIERAHIRGAAAERAASTLSARLATREAEAARQARRGEPANEDDQAEADRLRGLRDDARLRAAAARRDVHERRLALLSGAAEDPFPSLDPSLPVALLPVRLEVRFASENGHSWLLVRIYPDEVHDDSHEPALTEEEALWGKAFWARPDIDRPQAWEQLGERFGANRAAWIVRALEPGKDEPPGRAAGWTRGARTAVLPDYWLGIAYREQARGAAGPERPVLRFTGRGAVIPDPLQTGPSPQTDPEPAPTAAPYPAAGEPQPELSSAPSGAVLLDPGVRWRVDFQEALELGMALRIDLGPGEPKPLDRLIVVGVKASLSPAGAAVRLAELFDAHHYTDGLGLMPQGTPTNNVASESSGHGDRPPRPLANLEAEEQRQPVASMDDGSDGDRLAAALGVPTEVFAHVPNAHGSEDGDAAAMNQALWPATLGQYLDSMLPIRQGAALDPGADRRAADMRELSGELNKAVYAAARDHFVDFVRGRGPLPALRIGHQPYGVLPTTVLEPTGQEAAPVERELAGVLLRLRAVWRAAANPKLIDFEIGGVRRLHRNTPAVDPVGDLLECLEQVPVSRRVAARRLWEIWEPVVGGDLGPLSEAGALPGLAGSGPVGPDGTPSWPPMGTGWPELVPGQLPGGLGDLLGGTLDIGTLEAMATVIAYHRPAFQQEAFDALYSILEPHWPRWAGRRLLWCAFSELAPELRHPLVLPETVVLGGGLTEDGYIRALRTRPLEEIRQQETQAANWHTLRGNQVEALNEALGSDGSVLPAEPLLQMLLRRSVLASANGTRAPEMDTALEHLEGLPVTALERLLCESLDLCSYRLDAWITSLATRRLGALRSVRGHNGGVNLGGYGWLEDLRPGEALTLIDEATPEPGPLYESASNKGYVQAPSVTHATTAAILRTGYLSHAREEADDERGNPLAIDLCSRRLRLAQWLLDGVRQGQSLGALLGYRLERALHERRCDRYIPRLRELAPLQKLLVAMAPGQESITSGQVVDGWALVGMRETEAFSEALAASSDQDGDDVKAIHDEIAELGRAVDAVADGVLAESVHQLAQANPVRAGASLDAVAAGEAPPPELEVARTPRRGVAVTHRLLLLVGGEAEAERSRSPIGFPRAGWAPPQSSPRAVCEPRLNAWAATLLGDPARVRCQPRFVNDADGATVNSPGRTVSLSELGVTPLDVVYSAVSADEEGRSELEQRLALRVLELTDVPPGADLRLDLTGTPEAGDGLISFADLLEVARSVRSLLADAQPLDARDLALPQEQAGPGVDVDDLALRADTALAALQTARGSAETIGAALGRRLAALDDAAERLRAAESTSAAPAELARLEEAHDEVGRQVDDGIHSLRNALFQLARFNRPSAVPYAQGEPRAVGEELVAQASRVTAELSRSAERLTRAAELIAPDELRQHRATLDAAATSDELRVALSPVATLAKTAREELEAADVVDEFRTPLAALAGLEGSATPSSGSAVDSPAGLKAQVASAIAALDELIGRMEVDAPLATLSGLFGAEFRVLPRLRSDVIREARTALAPRVGFEDGGEEAVLDWFQRTARVRAPAARLETALMYGEALGGGSRHRFRVAQLPYGEKDRWVGLPGPDEGIPGGRVSLVANMSPAFDQDEPLAGLLVDEFVEVVPARRETAAVSFHFEAPNACAPQAILLAVPPDSLTSWDHETLERIVLETLELAQLRLVGSELLGEVGHFLPALHIPDTAVKSTDLPAALELATSLKTLRR